MPKSEAYESITLASGVWYVESKEESYHVLFNKRKQRMVIRNEEFKKLKTKTRRVKI